MRSFVTPAGITSLECAAQPGKDSAEGTESDWISLADRRRRALQLRADFAGRKTTPMQVLNLIAFVLAQVCVAHVQFHLAVKLCRLPHLRRSSDWGGALQN